MRVYLENMDTDGFGAVFELDCFEYDCLVTRDDGSTITASGYRMVGETDEQTAADVLAMAVAEWHELSANAPRPISAQVTTLRPAKIWRQYAAAGNSNLGEAQYVGRTNGTVIAEHGPGSCLDAGTDFDLDALAAARGVELVR